MSNKTLQDIANELGVSKATVSKALSDKFDVSLETKEKIMKLAEGYNYRPNRAAKLLSSNLRKTKIGVIYPMGYPESFWKEVKAGIRGAEEEYSDFGMEVSYKELKNWRNSQEICIKMDELINEKVDGIALVPVNTRQVKEKINQACGKGIAVATFNDDIHESSRIFYLGPKIKQSGRIIGELMGKFLRGKGNVMTINSCLPSVEFQKRMEGFLEVINEQYKGISLVLNYTYDREKIGYNEDLVLRSLIENTENLDGIYDVSGGMLEKIGGMIYGNPKLKNIVLIGHELSEGIMELMKTGVIDASICHAPYSQGYCVVKTLYEYILNGSKKMKHDMLYTKLEVVLKENMNHRKTINHSSVNDYKDQKNY